jgi:hypothetical protein
MYGAEMTTYSDDHDIAMVNDVGSKLRLHHADSAVNVSKDARPIFGSVEPLREHGNPIGMDRGALYGGPALLG